MFPRAAVLAALIACAAAPRTAPPIHNVAGPTDAARPPPPFAVLDLPPGEYVVAVYYLDSTLERGGVQIRAGAVEHMQLSMPPPVKAEPRITRTLAAP